jgi:hypothetical protein
VAKKPSQVVPPLSYSELAERQFIQTPEALTLMQSVREDLPDGKEPQTLIFLVTKQSGLYATFMGKIAAGSSFRGAAMVCGLYPTAVRGWIQSGSADLFKGLDTYCSRFYLDCQRAAALAVSDAEERVFRSDPAKWLARGPAKDFHMGRYWKEQIANDQEALENDPDNPINPIPKVTPDQVEDSTDDSADQQLAAALKELEKHNMITSEFVQQGRDQYKIDRK